MAKKKVFYCTKCGCFREHEFVGREKGALLEEIVTGIVSLGFSTLFKIAEGETIGGTTYWKCSKCKKIKEVS